MILEEKDKINMEEKSHQNNSDNKDIVSQSSNNGILAVKIDKLASAVYMVTDFLSDNEPLKWKLRNSSLSLVDGISASKYNDNFRTGFLINNLVGDINKIIALLSVGISGSNVSKMNFSILRQEFESVLNTILESNNLSKAINSIPNNTKFLDNNLAKTQQDESGVVEHGFEKETSKETSTVRMVSNREDIKETKIKAPVLITKKGEKVVSDKKIGRQEMIINYIKDHGWSSIADIASVDSSCSLKTIQRELSALVDKNVLKKKGERRWSRYQVV